MPAFTPTQHFTSLTLAKLIALLSFNLPKSCLERLTLARLAIFEWPSSETTKLRAWWFSEKESKRGVEKER